MTLGFSRNLGISNINEHYINTVVYEPTKGSSYIPLPVGLRNSTKGLVNLKNNENECFRWCHMHPQEKDPQRIKKSDKRMVEDLNYHDIEFSVSAKDYTKTEVQNNIN